VGLEQDPLNFVSTIESYLEEKVAAAVKKFENKAIRIGRTDHATSSIPQN
jgi:hypothetical protein